MQEARKNIEKLIIDLMQSFVKLVISFNGAGLIAIPTAASFFRLDVAAIRHYVLITGFIFGAGVIAGVMASVMMLITLRTQFKYLGAILQADRLRLEERFSTTKGARTKQIHALEDNTSRSRDRSQTEAY